MDCSLQTNGNVTGILVARVGPWVTIIVCFLTDNDSEYILVPGPDVRCTQHLATLHMVRDSNWSVSALARW